MVLIRLNPIIRGWSAYYRHAVSARVFNELDGHYAFQEGACGQGPGRGGRLEVDLVIRQRNSPSGSIVDTVVRQGSCPDSPDGRHDSGRPSVMCKLVVGRPFRMGEGAQVDLVTSVVTALAAGASAGFSGAATQAISDAYAGLKQLLRRCFAGRGQDPQVLDVEETEPEAWRARHGRQFTAADLDDEMRAARCGRTVVGR